VVPWHMGAMHPFEQILTLILAFGPFLVLGIVVVVRRRMDRLEEERERQNGVEGKFTG
jgi:hypothetical protein